MVAVKTRYGKFADDLLKVYPVDSTTVPKTARDLSRDAAFGWHTWSWARLQSRTGKSKVFYYYFDQHPDYPDTSKRFGYGSPPGQEVAYVFQHLDTSKPEINNTDIAIADAMSTYWTNFAKTGNPNGNGLPEWPKFNATTRPYLEFTIHNGPVVREALRREICDLYIEALKETIPANTAASR